MRQKLQFVYNAKTGLFNKLTDFAHKAISPATYNCNLCALTYGTFTMKQEWADYVKQLPLEVEFVYRNEWKQRASHTDYPLVALQKGEDEAEVLLDAKRLNSISSLQELKQVIQAALGKSEEGSPNSLYSAVSEFDTHFTHRCPSKLIL